MQRRFHRRDLLRHASAGAVLLGGGHAGAAVPLRLGGEDMEIRIFSVSASTVRLTVQPVRAGKLTEIPDDGALARQSWGAPAATFRGQAAERTVHAGGLRVRFTPDLLALEVQTAEGAAVQRIAIDPDGGGLTFLLGDAPLLGLGEGGPQFSRRSDNDAMRSGQGGYRLATNGARVPIPWIVGSSGWAIFVHHPSGSFDLTGAEGHFRATADASAGAATSPAASAPAAALPLDVFVVASREPAVIMAEYARLTGLPELPPLWSFGYQQSHRTLASREEILSEAQTFREKKLPCDTLIYLGTGFCPSGWNTNNGNFDFNRKVFPDPKAIFDQFHEDHFKVALHVAYPTGIRQMLGSVKDPCDTARRAETQASCYWKMHEPVFALGVDGWWPDEGDALDGPSRLVRNRMYWDGCQLDRPNERPFALHRNGYPGMQRYAAFLWSGDVYSTWETLRTQIPIGLNAGLSGIPYWGTDIGGFVPTAELSAELYVRWFQFGAFCPLFRCHGQTWKLRLPWGWNMGNPGPVEVSRRDATPDESQLHDARVEPICRKYLELRYRLLPYLYSAVREGAATGMPVMRALWLHYPGDPAAVARGDQYLWGKDMLVAPVVEKGAVKRRLYLPAGVWYDFWNGQRLEGGREITRAVDLETIPLYVRAGAILPMGPVKQYVEEESAAPLSISIYPGADGRFRLYEDDGRSFRYRNGEWMGIQMEWRDAARTLTLSLANGSRMIGAARREIALKAGQTERSVTFDGRRLQVRF
ncbi:MAG TPA: TIM-barrel domain-containing protein [Bryobacteraceae bacterium]|nr:TIM-barrel domain-containing protein [Bryobacteraceae bacterium]